MQVIRVSREGRLLHVTISRARKRNALSAETLHALEQAFDASAADDALVLAILTGDGDRAFAAGGDLHELQALRSVDLIEDFTRSARSALDTIRRFPVPVIAALNGDALGGGAELAMACDVRVAAPHARIGFLQGRLALSTAWGGGIDLMRLLGSAAALELVASARVVSASEALAIGLVNVLAPQDQASFDAFVRQWSKPWLEQSPRVMRAFKAQALAERLGLTRVERETLELSHFVSNWLHPDHWQAADTLVAGLGGRQIASE
jgi:enoyl-CoA hydratase